MRLPRPALLAALMVGAARLAAQPAATTAAVPTFGVLAGVGSATLGGDDVESPGRRTGFAGGVAVTRPFGAGGLALRPELLYVQKGARQREAFGGDFVDARLDLTYLELPVLLQYTVPTVGRVRPQLYAGPAAALRVGCRVRLRARFEGETLDAAAACEDAGSLGGDEEGLEGGGDVRRFDVGAVVGGALTFPLGSRSAAVGVRYTHGLATVASGADARNRAVLVYGAVEFPVVRRAR
jgi:hypothetical protein